MFPATNPAASTRASKPPLITYLRASQYSSRLKPTKMATGISSTKQPIFNNAHLKGVFYAT